MSVRVIHDFFPDSVKTLNRFVPWLLPHLFPDHIQKQCPTHVLDWQLSPELTVTVQWPWLIPAALLGVVTGIAGFFRSFNDRKAWSHGCLFFALMNLSAIVCHCLAPAYTFAWHVFAFADVVCTSVSAASFALASLLTIRPLAEAASFWTHTRLWGCTVALATVATTLKLLHVPHTSEFFYLHVTIVAVVIAFYCLVPREVLHPGPGRIWLAVSVVGVIIAAGGLAIDRWLCLAFGSAITYMVLLFWGCDIAVVGLDLYFAARSKKVKAGKLE